MKFDHPEQEGVSFELPEEWTVREVLRYDEVVELESNQEMPLYEKLWIAFKRVINPDDWDCDVDLEISFDERMSKRERDVIKFAGLVGWSARRAQDFSADDEKN